MRELEKKWYKNECLSLSYIPQAETRLGKFAEYLQKGFKLKSISTFIKYSLTGLGWKPEMQLWTLYAVDF